MAGGISITYVPEPIVAADKYYTLGIETASFRQPLKRCITDVMIPSINRNFSSGGRPSWTALAPDTIKDRGVYGYPPEPKLVRTGLLRRTATQQNIWNIDSNKAWIDEASFGGAQGGRAWYGLAQNQGFKGGKGSTTPARPFLTFTEEDNAKMYDVFDEWLFEKAVLAGWKVE